MSQEVVIATIAAPAAAAFFAGLGWLFKSAVTARAERAKAQAATADAVRELLNAAMAYNTELTTWHGQYGRPLMRFNQALFSLLQFGAGYREQRLWSGLIQAVESSLAWRDKSEVAQAAILTSPVRRAMASTSDLLTSTTDPKLRSACFALLDAIEATGSAYAGKGSNTAKRKAADEQFNNALQLLAEVASPKRSRTWRVLPRRRRELSASGSETAAESGATPPSS